MAFYAHPDVLDQGPNFIKTNCTRMVAIKTYAFGDTYATVNGAGNILAEATMASTDFTLASSGNDRTLTTASGKSDTSANATGAVTHIGFLDVTNSKVLWVTQETSGQTITSGNPVNFPSLVYTAKQPVTA
jgi:hypothetical protein